MNSDLSNSKKALNKTLQNKIKAFRRGNNPARKQKLQVTSALCQISNRLSNDKQTVSLHRSCFLPYSLCRRHFKDGLLQILKNKGSGEVHVFGETYGNNDDERRFKSGHSKHFEALKMGDRFKLIIHQSGQMKDLKRVSQPVLRPHGGRSDAKCKKEIAKKDAKKFKQNFYALFRRR